MAQQLSGEEKLQNFHELYDGSSLFGKQIDHGFDSLEL